MKLKWLFLFGLICLPVCIYLFLQAFGKNHFNIPTFHIEGIEAPIIGCDADGSSGQYFAKNFFDNQSPQATFESDKMVVYALGSVQSGKSDVRNNLLTFLNKFQGSTEVRFISLSTKALDLGMMSSFEHAKFHQSTSPEILNFGRCVLRVDLKFDSLQEKFSNSQLVLCDKERKIRGYYDPTELKEIDRLNTELHILLSN